MAFLASTTPPPPVDPNAVNVMNVLDVNPVDVAKWAAQHLIGEKLPEAGPNTAVSTVAVDAFRLLSVYPNRHALATELYGIVTGALANQKVAKKLATEKSIDTESNITLLSASQDILYRCIQTLEALREGAGRLMTSANNITRMGQ